jgi:asparagine synthetase B (glutamine-hydrolysing)
MCGHFGFISHNEIFKNKSNLKDFFIDATIAGAVRGTDGTGVLGIDAINNAAKVVKLAVNGSTIQNNEVYKDLTKSLLVTTMLGHNRKATTGRKDNECTHPFQQDNITLFHNGTLYYYDRAKFDVDSKSILHDLCTKETVKALEGIEGAFALVWYDSIKGTVNFARNSERKLYMAAACDSSMVYASERGMLEWLCERNNVPIREVVLLPEGKWISIDLETGDKTSTDFVPMSLDYYKFDDWSYYYSKRELKNLYKNTAVNANTGKVAYNKGGIVLYNNKPKQFVTNTTTNISYVKKSKDGCVVCTDEEASKYYLHQGSIVCAECYNLYYSTTCDV